jgi:hypothetical protein
VSPKFLRKAGILTRNKEKPYNLYTFDNQLILANNGKIDKKIGPISISIGNYQELLNLDIIEITVYDATFGLP